MRKSVKITEIDPPNEDGFVRVYISFHDHGEAIEVIGLGYDEAITRAVIIRDALFAAQKP